MENAAMNNRAALRNVPCESLCSAFSVLSILSVFSVLPLPAVAQTLATGRVITADSTPVRGVRVVLHRVGQDAQGPLDSTRADRQGMARFSFRPDSGAFYLLSAEYAGVEYFSPPLPTEAARRDTVVQILVYDTSSTAPLSLEARHLVVTRPAEDGSRGVLDLLVLRNDSRLTRVAPDSLHPSWNGLLPQGTAGLDVAESDFSREALARRGDSLLLLAPFAPGEKQITVQYLIPANRRAVQLPLGAGGTKLNVLAEETGVRVNGSGLALADSQVLQGRTFHRWTGTAESGSLLTITLPGSGRTPLWLLVVPVVLLTLVLLGAGWRLLSRPGVPAGRPAELIDAIAALDLRYAGRESETPGEEWSAYLAERARIKARLEASLAADPERR
jgi:hypothetical protein